jgi:hypothetical protein
VMRIMALAARPGVQSLGNGPRRLTLGECQQLNNLGWIPAPKKYQLPLIILRVFMSFQADDKGSTPFTRSNISTV